MCLNPILIKNVNVGNKSSLSSIKDSTSYYIPVPCGRCSVCLQLKQQYLVQRVQMEALNHDLYFGTLTYNNDMLPIFTVNDVRFAYADIDDWQNMIKMIRKYDDLPAFRYLVVSEYGGKRHRPHFHFILSFPKTDMNLAERWSFSSRLFKIFLTRWQRNINVLPGKFNKDGSVKKNTRSPIWRPLCTYVRSRRGYNFDLHYLDPWSSKNGLNDVAFYVSKYCLKYDSWVDKFKSRLFFTLSESDFKKAWSYLKPRRFMSKSFGSPFDQDVIDHINNGINMALSHKSALYPYFISPVDGSTYPLAPYYSKRFLTLNDLLCFNSRKVSLTGYDMMVSSESDLRLDQIAEKQRRFSVIQDFLSDRHTLFDDDANDVNNYLISNLYGNTQKNFLDDSDFAHSWEDY